ncbi:type II toxin-antitoxin system RelE/ParE family toxin [Rhizobium sp. 32-5/1]|uniref:type II toxin-antitoxin system RelE/ParE family toxin n=1 Tax=Rhizobium sp. 32-5/1 TaxID=3019602 RepID=UPI00240D58F5|nr:type II toxin-antitoxin system RelE/ParE family toxin [Rhizobium sp. 32-5/1]WEZ84209.1 type II toxin-antitoxin system RelE/ParE family toxin [Rhizobium sp. 32-5/1]
MIRSFKDKLSLSVANGSVKKGFPADLVRRAQQLLALLHTTTDLKDMMSPPGNRLEKLSGDREGQYSVRINQQWRICFSWSEGGADDVEIVDYH